METPGNDEPTPPTAADEPLPTSAQAPRPAMGPSTVGIPTVPTPAPGPSTSSEPVAVGDPFGGATATASITPPVPPTAKPPSSSGGGLGGDWPAQAADAIVNVVGAVRDNTTGRITKIARALVFGLFAGVLGVVAGVMLVILLVRLLNEALPSGVWLAYLVLGVVFVLLGALVFRKRRQPVGNTAPH